MLTIDIDHKSDNLIFMGKKMTATEVARNFSAVLDLVEAGESVEIYRGSKLVGVLSAPTQAPDLIERMREVFGDADNGGPIKPILDDEAAAMLEQVVADRYSPENMIDGLIAQEGDA
jgi:antitoxin (DNA-binding transcriptional repressor) of toxin-antitoxin stability system